MNKKTPTRRKPATKAASQAGARVSELVAMRVSRGSDGGVQIEARGGGYDIASGDRAFKSRPITFDGADRQLDTSTRRKLVSVSREMDRNSLLSAMLDRWIDGTVGSHLNFRLMTGDDGWNKAAYAMIRQRMDHCDHRGFFDATGLTRTMLRALGTDGEQLWTMTDEGLIQAVETHQIGSPRDKITLGSRLSDGIELDASGRPLGYWVSDEVYGGYITHSSKATYVAASNAILPAYRKRVTQTHGVPVATAGLKLYDRVDGYIDNESLAAEIDACLTYFVRRKNAPVTSLPQFGRAAESGSTGGSASKILQQIEPGMIARLGPDEEVEQFGAKRPGSQFTPFVETGLTMVGATLGVPLALALLDFKRLNYSNTRSLLLQMWQTWQIWHRCVVVPCWQWVTQRWLLREIARSPRLKARDDAFAIKWLPRRWPWVDPLKEVQALREEIAMGGGTLTDYLEMIGYTLEEYLEERGGELRAFAKAGVPTTTVGGKPVGPLSAPVNDAGQAAPADNGDGNSEPTDDEEIIEP